MDALWERTDFVWTLTWLGHGCSVGTDRLCVDVNMVHRCSVGTDGLCVDVSMVGTYGCSVGTDGLCVDVNMVGTWMLCGNGRTLCGR